MKKGDPSLALPQTLRWERGQIRERTSDFVCPHSVPSLLGSGLLEGYSVASGGGLAFGLIPTLVDLSGLAPDDLLARWVGAAVGGDYDLDQLAAQSLIALMCPYTSVVM